MITTSRMLERELQKDEDSFITVKLNEKEYIIENIRRIPDFVESPSYHWCLEIRDGGEGYIKR